jgi:hypothetical protein
MAKSPAEDPADFLARQPKETLVAVLLELAQDHEVVQARLARLQLADQPDKLAAGFKKTLATWKRSSKFYGYRAAGEFGRTLEGWLDQVERELCHKDPPAALALFQSFIEADASWFERADDSDGVIGDAVRSACQHWLRAAARCETTPSLWPDRLLSLCMADEYGARGELLSNAGLLLDEVAQRELVAKLDAQLSAALEACPTPENPPPEIFRISGALSLLSESLRDPDVKVRAALRYSPDPNLVQRQAFARAYIEADRPADALAWLQDGWGHLEDSRLGLLAEALEKLGRFEESVPIRRGMFERTMSDFYLDLWLQHLPEAARLAARDHAHELALAHPDLAAAATVLLKLDDPAAAEARLLAEPGRIDGNQYGSLVPLAKALRNHDCPRGETVIYRALLKGILDRAYARAYGHAARYWSQLQQIANGTTSLLTLTSHDEFEAEIRARHGRKTAFWAHVNGTRREWHDGDDDE